MDNCILITVLSWEERFIIGIEKDNTTFNPEKIILLKYNNPLTSLWKKENLTKVRKLFPNKLLEIDLEVSLTNHNWVCIANLFKSYCTERRVVLDITTMTRESIWISLYNCLLNRCKTEYIYYKPKRYSKEWISRDPGKPRLLYKMSGVAKLGASTLLLVTTGYDIQRLDSLIYNFEPKQTILFFQNGDTKKNTSFLNNYRNQFLQKHKVKKIFKYDAFDIESSFNLIEEQLLQIDDVYCEPIVDSYNVILNSLGPKTSAITLFKIWLKYPQVALSYIPSKEYNKDYSFGINGYTTGKIDFEI